MVDSPQSTRRGPYRAGVRRREQLVGVAIDVFAEHGYAGASIRSIAERAGVSHASLIQHFGSKEGLFTAVLAEWDQRAVQGDLAQAEGLDYFRALPQVMAAHEQRRGLLELFTTVAAEASSPAHPARDFITGRYRANLATLAGHLRLAVQAGEVAALSEAQVEVEVRLLTAALDGIGLQWLLDPSTDMAGCVSVCVERSIRAWQGVERR